MIEYEAEGFRGTLLMAGEETQAGEVTYAPARRGWHDIYLGMFNTAWVPFEPARLWVKLSADPAYTLLYFPKPESLSDRRQRIREIFWKSSDLTGATLSFKQVFRKIAPPGQRYGNVCDITWVAYIKLVPLNEAEVVALQRDRQRADTKRLFATNDAWSFHYERLGEDSAEAIRSQLEHYRHTDFARVYWEAARGDLCNYPTRIGRTWTSDDIQVADYTRAGDRLVTESWNSYKRQGVDPLQIAVEHSHDMGLEFHAAYRLGGGGMGAFYYSPPFDAWNKGGFYEKHPELRCVRRDGSPAPRISYAFPETRRFVLSVLREVVERYPADGLALLFNRRPPLLEYEPPLVESFRAKYGKDPRELEDSDPEWLAHRCAVLTGFMRRLRELSRSSETGRRLELSAWVLGSEAENVYYGLDVRTWIREGLLDTVIPYTSAARLSSWEPAWEKPADVQHWLDLTRGSPCRLALNIMPRDLSAEAYRRKADVLYKAGVEHLAFWDSAMAGAARFDVLRRLGHSEEIAAWIGQGAPPIEPPGTLLRTLDGWEMSYIPE
jgi:hypothetical protein